ncbi:hypothetical protein OESDEN_01234 [Oesophagostomum dentatum]|uniref:Integrase catalytic domain-containing protein n=1 Tax=Oesophagostomum dentatum TaxID=61180 RepID=A0A0B1TNE1_OESDE|nr:hypothetical protein OESDEN_01234 [Oesophagostomum dentatum]
MTSTTILATTRKSNRLCAHFGNPETIASDNGSQFASTEFAEFCSANGISHIRLPPFHPPSSGRAERFVDAFKRALKKFKDSGRRSKRSSSCKRTASSYSESPNA